MTTQPPRHPYRRRQPYRRRPVHVWRTRGTGVLEARKTLLGEAGAWWYRRRLRRLHRLRPRALAARRILLDAEPGSQDGVRTATTHRAA